MFEFTSTAVEVARQQLLWAGLVGGVGSIIFVVALARGKSRVPVLIGAALMAGGGWYLHQSWQLGSSGGEWSITIDNSQIKWQSPNESVDGSFTVDLAEVDYYDRGARASRGDERPLYHLVMKDGTAIQLSPVSGIDLESVGRHLNGLGIETRQTGRFHTPVELRNR